MREILYRGKRKGKWIEGYYFKHNPLMVCFEGEKKPDVHYIVKDGCCDWNFEPPIEAIEIDPETLGQYIWRKDKNGKKIFEGDILTFQDDKGELNYYFEIIWHEDYCSFGFVAHKNPKSSDNYIPDGTIGIFDHFESENWEVIGNLYDNPELIEEVK